MRAASALVSSARVQQPENTMRIPRPMAMAACAIMVVACGSNEPPAGENDGGSEDTVNPGSYGESEGDAGYGDDEDGGNAGPGAELTQPSRGSAVALSPDDSTAVVVNRDVGTVTVLSLDYESEK